MRASRLAKHSSHAIGIPGLLQLSVKYSTQHLNTSATPTQHNPHHAAINPQRSCPPSCTIGKLSLAPPAILRLVKSLRSPRPQQAGHRRNGGSSQEPRRCHPSDAAGKNCQTTRARTNAARGPRASEGRWRWKGRRGISSRPVQEERSVEEVGRGGCESCCEAVALEKPSEPLSIGCAWEKGVMAGHDDRQQCHQTLEHFAMSGKTAQTQVGKAPRPDQKSQAKVYS